jgi:hypothetical protein
MHIAVEESLVVKSCDSHLIGKKPNLVQVRMMVEGESITERELFSSRQLFHDVGQSLTPVMLVEGCGEALTPVFVAASHTSC